MEDEAQLAAEGIVNRQFIPHLRPGVDPVGNRPGARAQGYGIDPGRVGDTQGLVFRSGTAQDCQVKGQTQGHGEVLAHQGLSRRGPAPDQFVVDVGQPRQLLGDHLDQARSQIRRGDGGAFTDPVGRAAAGLFHESYRRAGEAGKHPGTHAHADRLGPVHFDEVGHGLGRHQIAAGRVIGGGHGAVLHGLPEHVGLKAGVLPVFHGDVVFDVGQRPQDRELIGVEFQARHPGPFPALGLLLDFRQPGFDSPVLHLEFGEHPERIEHRDGGAVNPCHRLGQLRLNIRQQFLEFFHGILLWFAHREV